MCRSLTRCISSHTLFVRQVWAATVGDIAVCTQSGVSGLTYDTDFGENVANTHIPQIKQTENVALIAYRPVWDVVLLSFLGSLIGIPYTTQVALLFPTDRFHEVVESGHWIAGRKDENYVAVWRHSLQQQDCSSVVSSSEPCDEYYYSNPRGFDRPQAWAVVVGDSGTHVSFTSFTQSVFAGRLVERKPIILFRLFGQKYQATLQVDGKDIEVTI